VTPKPRQQRLAAGPATGGANPRYGDADAEDAVTALVEFTRAAAAADPAGALTGRAPPSGLREQSIAREVLVRHEAMCMRPYAAGPVYTGLVRLLMRARDRVQLQHDAGRPGRRALLGGLNVIAYGCRSLPRVVFPWLERLRVRLFAGRDAAGRLRAALYRDGLPLEPLIDVAGQIPQTPSCRAFVRDDKNHTAVGVVVGFDLLKCGGRWAVIEANSSIGQQDQWLLRKDDNPFIRNMFAFAKAAGFGRLCVVNNDRGLQGMQDRLYREATEATGIGLEIIEPASVPETCHARSAVMPADLEPGTLCVRIRAFPSWPDFVLGNKEVVHRVLRHHFESHGIEDLFVPDSGPGWLERVNWKPGAYPNVVMKLAGADRGIGVAFYKLRDRRELSELMAKGGESAFRHGGMLGRLVRASRAGAFCYQAYVPSDLSAEQRLATYRASVLITPVGSRLLSVTKNVAAKPVPATLDYGPVADPMPYLVHAALGATRTLPDTAEVVSLEKAAVILADAMAANLGRHFRVRD